jgi:hypothetical protein
MKSVNSNARRNEMQTVMKTCPSCDGMNHHPMDVGFPCPECGVAGVVPIDGSHLKHDYMKKRPAMDELEKKVGRQLRKAMLEMNDAGEDEGLDSGSFLYSKGCVESLEMVLRMINPNSKWLEWVTPINPMNDEAN